MVIICNFLECSMTCIRCVHFKNKTLNLTLSALQTNTSTFANSVDPDEMAHYEPSHQDLHCLPFCFILWLISLVATMNVSKFKNGRVHFRNLGVKGLNFFFSEIMDLQKSSWKISKV